jgi:hypothetical protein
MTTKKAATALQVSSEVLSKCWVVWIHAQGFWDQNFLEKRRIFSQVSEDVCQERHLSCVRIRIMEVGKAVCQAKIPLCYFNQSGESTSAGKACFEQSFRASIYIGRIYFRNDGELIDMCWQSRSVCTK